MPFDKWGIPFLYPTAQHAGVTGSGTGFFWEQNNNFRVDETNGMLRLGKETDQCELIDSATGTWEFPYLTDGDGLSISGSTGHHTGGVTHGCQGFAYMCDGKFDVSPPTFRFRKETYHVQYNNDPQTGVWTSPFATQPNSGVWKGYGWVRYNKKNGRSAGKDSVVLEVWWNDDATADITNWKMLKRTEDKGAGISNWGVPATCDGDAYQVGTWTAIQFRFKSSASDFSLHPLHPEHNEGQNIDAIGGEDMSFADSEDRGYSYAPDVPRDIEMKCLFKWDAGGRGKCHFKNISLREIDPTLSFDDNTSGGTPDNPPTEGTTTIQGSFKTQWDVNTLRTSPCAGAGSGGGGGSGNTTFYTIDAVNSKTLSNSTLWVNRTRVAEQVLNSSSSLNGKLPIQLDVPLLKVGTPGASPVVSAKIWSAGGSVVYTSPTTIDPTTLTDVDFQTKTFDFSTNTHILVTGDKIGVEWVGTSDANFVRCGWDADVGTTNQAYTEYESGVWQTPEPTMDFACSIWQ